MKNKEDLKNELHELSPFLEQLRKQEDGFKVPEHYFSSLADEVMKKVHPVQSGQTAPAADWTARLLEWLMPFYQPRYVLALASAAILVTAGILLLRNDNPEACPDLLACIPDESLEQYLENQIHTFDSGLLEQAFATTSGNVLPSIELEEIEDYMDEVIDEMDLKDLEEFL